MSGSSTHTRRFRQTIAALAAGVVIGGSAAGGSAIAQDLDVAPTTVSLNPLSSLTLQDAPDFRAKPLFSSSRKPRPEPFVSTIPTAAPPAVAPSTANLQLIGTVRTASGTVARIQDAASASTLSLKAGDVIGGWKITRIEATSVHLEQSEHTAELKLFIKGAPRLNPAETPTAQIPRPSSSMPTATATTPSTLAPAPSNSGGAAPPGTVAGTAAAEAAARSTAKLVFGTAAPASSTSTAAEPAKN